MPWNSDWPLGSVSVKANKATGLQNTAYIETTMGNSIVGTNTNTTRDHFWNVDGNLDGRHRFIQSVGFTSTALAPNEVYPVLGADMQTVLFPLETNGEVQWFHKNEDNNNKIYQFIPNFLTGTVDILSAAMFVNIIPVPANVYGEIILFRVVNDGSPENSIADIQVGNFISNNNTVHVFSNRIKVEDTGDDYLIEFENEETTDLNIRARRGSSAPATWNYRITYRAV